MSELLKYRIHCDTEGIDQEVWLPETAPVPTTCPTNTEHAVTQPAEILETLTLPYKTTDDGRQIVTSEKAEGSRLTLVTHDFTDPTTWYMSSERVIDQAGVKVSELSAPPGSPGERDTYHVGAAASGAWVGQEGKIAQYVSGAWKFFSVPAGWSFAADKAFVFPHGNVIDLYHAKVWDEDNIVDPDGNPYRVGITVDAIEATEHDPHYEDQDDYYFIYGAGVALFGVALSGSAVVLGTYHKMVNSKFIIQPEALRKIDIEAVDVQFALDVKLRDTAMFDIQGLIDVHAPQLIGVGGLVSGMYVSLMKTRYKSMRDYQAECDRAYAQYPAMGGDDWRGLQQPTVVFHWDYLRVLSIKSSQYVRLEISLEHDRPYEGSFSSASLYCVSKLEE